MNELINLNMCKVPRSKTDGKSLSRDSKGAQMKMNLRKNLTLINIMGGPREEGGDIKEVMTPLRELSLRFHHSKANQIPKPTWSGQGRSR
mgnify:CR=1 FL=1